MEKVSSRVKSFSYHFRRIVSVLLAFSIFTSTFPQEAFSQLTVAQKPNSAGVKFYQNSDGTWDYELTGEGPWSGKGGIKNLAGREDIIKAAVENAKANEKAGGEAWAKEKGLMGYGEYKEEVEKVIGGKAEEEMRGRYAGYIEENRMLLEGMREANPWMRGGIKTEEDLDKWWREYLREEKERLDLVDAVKKASIPGGGLVRAGAGKKGQEDGIRSGQEEKLEELVKREILYVGELRRAELKYIEGKGDKGYGPGEINGLVELYGKMWLGEGERERGLEYFKRVVRGMEGYCSNDLVSKDTITWGEASKKRDGVCVEMSKALIGIGLLGGEEGDGEVIESALEKYYLTRSGASVLVNGISGLLMLGAEGKVRGFILGRVERDIIEKGYGGGMDVLSLSAWVPAVGDLVDGRYTNKITEPGNYILGNEVYLEGVTDRNQETANVWEDIGEMLATDPATKGLSADILGEISIIDYGSGKIDIEGIGNKPLITGILSAKSVRSGKVLKGYGSVEEVYLRALYNTRWSDLSEKAERRLKNKAVELYEYYGGTGSRPGWMVPATYNDKKQQSAERYKRAADMARAGDLVIAAISVVAIGVSLGKSLINGIQLIKAAKAAGVVGDIWTEGVVNIRALDAYRARVWGVEGTGLVRGSRAAFAADASLGTDMMASRLPAPLYREPEVLINPKGLTYAGGKAGGPEVIKNTVNRGIIRSGRPQVPQKMFGENIGGIKTETAAWKDAGSKTAADAEFEKFLERSGYHKEYSPDGKMYRYVRESWAVEKPEEWTKMELRGNLRAKELQLEKEYLSKNGLEIETSGNGKYFRYAKPANAPSKIMLDLRKNVVVWDKEGQIMTYELDGKIYKYDARYDGNIAAGTLADDDVAALHRRVNNPKDPLRRQYKNVNGRLELAAKDELGVVKETFGLSKGKTARTEEFVLDGGLDEMSAGNIGRVTLPVKSKRPQVIKAVNMLGDASVAAASFVAPMNDAAAVTRVEAPTAVVRAAEVPNAFDGVKLIKPEGLGNVKISSGADMLRDVFKTEFGEMGSSLIRNTSEGAGFELGRGNYAGFGAGSMLWNTFVYAPLKTLNLLKTNKTASTKQIIKAIQQTQNINAENKNIITGTSSQPVNNTAEQTTKSARPVIAKQLTFPTAEEAKEKMSGYMYLFGRKIYDDRFSLETNPLTRLTATISREIDGNIQTPFAAVSVFPFFEALSKNKSVSEKRLKDTLAYIIKSAYDDFEYELFKNHEEAVMASYLIEDERFLNLLLDYLDEVLVSDRLNAEEKEIFKKAFLEGLSKASAGPRVQIAVEQKRNQKSGFFTRFRFDPDKVIWNPFGGFFSYEPSAGDIYDYMQIIMDAKGGGYEGVYVAYPEFFKDVRDNALKGMPAGDQVYIQDALSEASYNAARVIVENAQSGNWRPNPVTSVLYDELKKSLNNNKYLSDGAKTKFQEELVERFTDKVTQGDLLGSVYSKAADKIVDDAAESLGSRFSPDARILARVLFYKAMGASDNLQEIYQNSRKLITSNTYLNAEQKWKLLQSLSEEITHMQKGVNDNKIETYGSGSSILPMNGLDFELMGKFIGNIYKNIKTAYSNAKYSAALKFFSSADWGKYPEKFDGHWQALNAQENEWFTLWLKTRDTAIEKRLENIHKIQKEVWSKVQLNRQNHFDRFNQTLDQRVEDLRHAVDLQSYEYDKKLAKPNYWFGVGHETFQDAVSMDFFNHLKSYNSSADKLRAEALQLKEIGGEKWFEEVNKKIESIFDYNRNKWSVAKPKREEQLPAARKGVYLKSYDPKERSLTEQDARNTKRASVVLNGKKILIIDDDVREEEAFKYADTRQATNKSEGLTMLQKAVDEGVPYSFILLDYQLHDEKMDYVDFVNEAKKISPGILVIGYSTGFGWKDEDLSVLDADTDKMLGDNFFNFIEERLGITAKQKERPVIDYGHKILDTKLPAGSKPSAAKIQMFVREYNRFNSSLDRVEPDGALSEVARTENYIKYLYSKQWENLQNLIRDGQRDEFIYNAMFYLNELPSRDRDVRLFSGLNRFEETKNILFSTVASEPEFGKDGKNRLLSELDVILNFDTYYPITIYELDLMKRAFEDTFQSSEDNKRLAKEVKNISERLNKVSPVLTNKFNKEELISPNDIFYARADILDDIQYIKSMLLGIWLSKDLDILSREKVDKILNINDRLSKEFPYALPDIWEYTTGWPVFLKKYVENSDFVVDEQERNYDPLAFFDNPLWRQEKIAIIERMLERLNSKLRGSQDTDAALRKKMDKISKQATNFLYNYYYAAADKLYKAEVEGRPIDAAKAKTYYNLIHYQRGMIKYEGRRFTAASDKLISNIFEIDKTLKGNRNYRDIIDEMRSMTPDFPSVESLSVPGGKSGYFTTGGLTPEGIENLFAGAGGFIKGLLLPLIGNRLPDIQTSVPVPMENSAASVPLQKSVGPLQSAPPVSAPVENSAVSTALQESAAPQQYAPPAYLSSKSKNTLEQERDIASVSPEIRKKAEAATFALVTHKGTSFANLTLVEFEINNKKEKYLVTSAHAADLDDMAFVRPKNWQKGDLPLLVKEFLRIPALDIVLFSVPEELDGVEPLKASEIPVQNGDKVYSLSVHNDNESAGHIQDIFSPGGILSSLWAAEIGTCGSAMLNSDGQVVGIRNKKTQHSGLSKYFSLPTGDFFPEDAPVGVISDYIKYKLYGIDSSRPVYVLGQRAFDIKTSQSLKDGYIYWYDEDGTIMAKGPNRALIAPEYKLVNNLESLLLLEDDFYKNGNYGIKLVLKNDNGSEDKIDIVIKGGKVIKVTTPALKEQAAPLSAPAENSAAGQNIFNLKNDGPLYMFDMDGTITPDHAPMTENTAAWLREFVKTHNVFIVTGTNYDHVVTQIPADIIDNLSGVYSSMGNELHVQNRVIYSKAFAGAPNLSDALDALLKDSGWTGARYNEHTKTAAGEIIFNVAGLDAPAEVLTAYKDWDARTGERADFAKRLSAQFPNLNVVLPKSGNIVIRDSFDGKETALKHARGILPDRKIIYAGNEEQAGGNDYGAAQFLQQQGNSEIYKISSAEEIPATFANPSSSAQNADLKNINKSWSKFTLFRLSENIKEFKSNLPKHGFKYAAGLFFTRTARWAAQTAVDFYRHRYEPRENYPRIAADGYELNIADLQSSPYASSVFYSPKKTASGFVVEYKGKVYGLASGHVFPFPGRTETIKSLSGKEYKVKVLASGSPYTLQAGVPDIAALELPPEALADFKPLPLADEDVKAGDTVDSPGFVKQDISMVPYFINNRIVLSNDGSKLITSYNFKDFFVGFCGSPLVLAREGTVVGLHKGSYYDRKNSLAVNLTVLKNFLDYVQTGAAPDYTITLAGGGTHAIPFNKVVRLSKDAEQNIKNLQAQSQTSAPATPAQTLPPPDYLTSKSEKTLEQERDIADISPEIRKKAEAATFVLTADKEGHAFANLTLVEFEINGKKEKYLVTSAHAVENGKPAFFRPKDWHKGDVPLQAEEFLRIDALDIALFTAPKELEGVEPLKAAQTPAKNNEKVYSVSFVPRKEESTGYIKDISSPEGILSSLWAEGGTCGSAILNSEGDVVGIRNYARFHPGLSKYFSLPNVDFFPEDAPVGIISDYLKYKLYGIDSARPVYVLGQYVFDIATSQSILTGPEGTRIVSKPNGTQFSFQRKVINNLESLWSLNNDFYKDKDLMIVILKNSDGSKEKINIGIKDSKVTGVNKNQLLDAPPATAPAAVNKSWVERQKDNLANWLENKFTLRFLDSGNGKTAADITVDNNYAENKTLLQDKTFIVVTQDKSGADNIISALQKYVPPEQIKYFPGVRPAVRYFISNDRVPVEKLVVLTDMNFDAEDTFEQHGSSLMNFKKESQEIPVIIINPGRSQLLEKFFEQGYDGLLSGGGAADDIAAFIKDKNLKPSQMPQAKMFTPEELDVIRFLEQDDLSKENLKDIRANDDKLQDIIYNFSDKVENDQNPFTLLMYGKLYELQHGIQDRLAALAQKELAEDTAAKPKSSPYQNLGFIAFDPQASAERWHAGTLKFFDVIKNLFIPAPAVMRFAASVGFASAPVQTIPSAVVMGMPGISSAQHAAKRTKYFWDDIDEVIARLESLNRMPDWNNFAERELYYDVNSLQSGDILNLSLQQKTKLNKLIEKYKTAAALAAAPKNNKPDGVSWSERLAAAQAKAASAAYAVKIASSPAEEDKLVNEFNDFISEHDRMPSPKQPGEKGLYLRVYRAMRDTKNPARAQKLKKIWDANISKSYHSEKRLQNSRADIEQTIRELTAFVEANKKFPPAKSSLYLKSMRIKNGIRQGVTPDDISAVEKLWRIDFDNTIAELEAYTLTYHQLPQNHTKYQNLYERGLALKEGRVESASEEQVKKARDIWDKTAALQNEEKIKKLTQKLKDFIAKYKRLPNDSVKGSAESKFYTALYIVKNNESGIYTAEQLAELNQMWDEYWHIARTNVVAETIKKLEVFTAANNRLPDGRKSDEWGLYNSGLAIKNGETKSATAAQQQYVSDIWDKYAMRRKKTDAPEKTAYAAANAAGSGLTLKEKPVKYSAAGRAADDFVIKMPAEAKPSETVPVNGGGNGKSEYIRSNGDIETIIARLEDFTAAKGRMPLWENADERDFYYDISGIKNGTIYATSQQIAKIRKISEVYNHTAAPADNGKPSEKKPWSERLENGKANKTAAALSSAEPVSKIISVAPASAAASPSVKPAAAVTIDKLVKELNDFISAHGRLPSSEQPGEKGLYLRVYRAMRNTENPARAARLQIIWDENISQSHYSAKRRQNGGDTVEQAVQELTKYVELNKEFPPAHSSLYLKSMAIKSGRRKEATPEQISAVEKLWRIDHDNTIAEFEDYVSKYGKMPQLLTESQPLYLRALALKNGKTVSASAEQVQKMKDVWDSSLARLNAEKINKLTEDLKNFIAANGRLPRDLEKGSDESRLYHAVYVVVNRASPYTAEQLAEIKDLWDKYWYIARPNSVAERIKKLEEFTSAHGRMPDNRKSGEWSLYSAALLIKNGVNKSASEEQRKHVAEIWDKYAVQHKADGAKQSPDADGNAAGVNLTSAEEPAKYSAAARAADDFVIKMPAAEPLPEVKTQEKIPDNDNVPPQNLPPPAYLSSKAEQSLGQERNIDDIPIAIRKKAQNATFVLVTSSDISTSIANISLVEFDINGKKEKYLVTSAHALEPGELAFFKHRNWPKDAQPIYAKEFLRINTLDIVLYTVPEELDGVEPLKASGIPAGNGDKVYSISVHNDNKESAGHIQDIFSPGGILSSMWAEEGGGCGIAMLNSAGEVTGIRNHKTVHPGLSKYFFLPTESLFPEDVPVSLISDYLKYKLYGIDSPRPVYVLGQHVFDILISQSVTDGYMAWYDKNGKKSESGAHRTQRTQGYKLINNLESLWKQLGEGYPKYEIELTLKNRGGSEEEISIEINGGKVTGLKKENLGTENQPQNTRFDKTALKSNAPISAGRYTYSLLPPFNILWSAAEFIYKKISALRTRGDNTRAAAAQTEEMFSAPAAEKPAKYVPDSRADDISAVTSAPVLREEETSAQALPPPDYLTSKSETSIWQERNINGISPEIRKKAEDAVFILHSSGEAWANITLAEFEIKDKTGKTETKTYLVTANHVVVSGEPALFRPKNWQKGEPLLHAEEFLRIPELDIALFQVPEELKGTEPLKAGETPARNGDRVYSVSALNHGKESSGYIKDINGTAGILSSLWADGTGTCGSPMVNTETGELEGIRNAKMEAPALSRHFGLDANDYFYFPYDVPAYIISDYISYKLYGVDSSRPVYVSGQKVFDIKTSQSAEDAVMRFEGKAVPKRGIKLVNNLESLWGRLGNNQDFKIEVTLRNSGGSKEKINIEIKDGKVINNSRAVAPAVTKADEEKSNSFQNLGIAFNQQARAEQWAADTWKFLDIIKNLFLPVPVIAKFVDGGGFAEASAETASSVEAPVVRNTAKRTKYFWYDIDEVIERLENLGRMPARENPKEKELYYDINSLTGGEVLNITPQQKSKLNKLIEKYKNPAAASTSAPKNNKQYGLTWAERRKAVKAKAEERALAAEKETKTIEAAPAASPVKEDGILAELNEFIAENGKLPGPKHLGERSLYLRLNRAMNNEKNPELAAAIKKIWEDNKSKSYQTDAYKHRHDKQIERTVRDLKKYVETNKDVPPFGTALNLRSLDIKSGRTKSATEEQIAEVKQLWTVTLDNNIKELEDFTAEHGRLPDSNKKEERALYAKMNALKKGDVVSALPEQIEKTKALWDKYSVPPGRKKAAPESVSPAAEQTEKTKKPRTKRTEEDIDNIIEKTREFAESNGRLPNTNIKGSEEDALYNAAHGILAGLGATSATEKQLAALQAIWDKYKNIARVAGVAETIKELKQFMSDHEGRLPDSRKEDEWALYNAAWKIKTGRNQFATAEERKITTELWNVYVIPRGRQKGISKKGNKSSSDKTEKAADAKPAAEESGILGELNKFISENGRLPSSKRQDEHAFYVRINRAMNNEKKPEQAAAIKKVWEDYKRNSDSGILGELNEFVAENGRLPSSEQPSEKSLYFKVYRAIKDEEKPEQAAAIKKVWEDNKYKSYQSDMFKQRNDDTIAATVQELEEYVKLNNKLPPLDSSLYSRSFDIKSGATKTATPEQVNTVKKLWGITVDNYIKELEDFIAEHGRMPNSNGGEEHALYEKLYKIKKGKTLASDEQQKKVQDIWDKWAGQKKGISNNDLPVSAVVPAAENKNADTAPSVTQLEEDGAAKPAKYSFAEHADGFTIKSGPVLPEEQVKSEESVYWINPSRNQAKIETMLPEVRDSKAAEYYSEPAHRTAYYRAEQIYELMKKTQRYYRNSNGIIKSSIKYFLVYNTLNRMMAETIAGLPLPDAYYELKKDALADLFNVIKRPPSAEYPSMTAVLKGFYGAQPLPPEWEERRKEFLESKLGDYFIYLANAVKGGLATEEEVDVFFKALDEAKGEYYPGIIYMDADFLLAPLTKVIYLTFVHERTHNWQDIFLKNLKDRRAEYILDNYHRGLKSYDWKKFYKENYENPDVRDIDIFYWDHPEEVDARAAEDAFFQYFTSRKVKPSPAAAPQDKQKVGSSRSLGIMPHPPWEQAKVWHANTLKFFDVMKNIFFPAPAASVFAEGLGVYKAAPPEKIAGGGAKLTENVVAEEFGGAKAPEAAAYESPLSPDEKEELLSMANEGADFSMSDAVASRNGYLPYSEMPSISKKEIDRMSAYIKENFSKDKNSVEDEISAAAAQSPASPEEEIEAVLKDKTLIFADDEENRFKSYGEVFKPYVKEIKYFPRAGAAINYMRENKNTEKFIVITDIFFEGGRNGFDVLHEAKSIDKNIPVFSLNSRQGGFDGGFNGQLIAEVYYPERMAITLEKLSKINTDGPLSERYAEDLPDKYIEAFKFFETQGWDKKTSKEIIDNYILLDNIFEIADENVYEDEKYLDLCHKIDVFLYDKYPMEIALKDAEKDFEREYMNETVPGIRSFTAEQKAERMQFLAQERIELNKEIQKLREE